MAHSHSHHHEHSVSEQNINTAFIIGIAFNFLFVVVEAFVGFYIHSLSLLSDAGHNLADVGALALSLLAFRLLKVKSSEQYTYGYRKTSILVALFNAMALLVSIGAIVFEAVHRFFYPAPMQGIPIAIVAAVGIVINAVTAFLFFKNKENDINLKSAYLHLLSDAVVSFVIVIGGVLIYYTQWFWIDSLLSILVAVVILLSTWRLLKDSLRLSLDGVPANIDLNVIKSEALKVAGVKDVHHIHIWAISTTENALTAHVVLASEITILEEEKVKQALKHQLQHQNIQHITLETEREHTHCEKECR